MVMWANFFNTKGDISNSVISIEICIFFVLEAGTFL